MPKQSRTKHRRAPPAKAAGPRVRSEENETLHVAERDLAMLSEHSSRLWRALSLEQGVDEMLAAVMMLLGATKGSVQLLNGDILVIAAQSGFDKPYLDAFRALAAQADSACALALRRREQVVIEDIEKDAFYATQLAATRDCGYRAVVATPLLSWHGSPLGVISAHFDRPHRPTLRALTRLDQYMRQAGAFMQRYRTEEELRHNEEQLQAILNATVDGLVTIDAVGVILTFNHAAERIFGYTAAEAIGHNVSMLMPPGDRERHDDYIRRYQRTGVPHIMGKPRGLLALRKNGDAFPIQLTVCQVDHRRLYVGSVRDMTEHAALQEEILRIAELEQQRIGQELHDGTQQELTGLGLLAHALVEGLSKSADGKVGELAARLADGIEQARQRVQIMARGMVPLSIDRRQLMPALAELIDATQASTGLACRFECPQPILLSSDEAATHLYRIVQEAIGNAVKHSHAKLLTVRMERSNGGMVLDVLDDGVGIDEQRVLAGGIGLRLMAYRSALIGGELSVSKNKGGGTVVRCNVAHIHHEHS